MEMLAENINIYLKLKIRRFLFDEQKIYLTKPIYVKETPIKLISLQLY